MLAHRLGCELADQIAAIVPVSGALSLTACDPSRSVPVLQFYGTADPLVSAASVERGLDRWRALDRCTDVAAVSFSEGNASCVTNHACADGVESTACKLEGGSHWWPGGIGDTSPLAATDALWEFCSRVRLP